MSIAALAIWAGAAITGAPLTIGAALAGALNTAPIAWLAVGAASSGRRLAAVSCRCHRRAAGGRRVPAQRHHPGHASAPTWVVDLSPFAHLAAVPNAPPDWAAIAAFIVIGAILIALGIAGLRPPRPDHMKGCR